MSCYYCDKPIVSGAHFANGEIRGVCEDHKIEHETNAKKQEQARLARTQLKTIYEFVDRNFLSGNFGGVDEFLKTTTPRMLSEPTLIIGVLTITFAGKDRLQNREAWLRDAESFLNIEIGPERTKKLLQNRR